MKKWGSHNRYNIKITRQRFLEKVKKTATCHIWIGSISSHGYGSMSINSKAWMAHRAAVFLFKNKHPGKKEVMHTCDNPLCVNLKHLRIGTHQDNMIDMESKKRSRHPRGEASGRSKLKEKDVIKILNKHKNGMAIRAIARQFPVSKTNISAIVKKKIWKHIHITT